MTSLNEIHGLNKYCGPAVIAALTGLPTEECAAAIQFITGQKSDIKAVHMNHLIATFKKLRFDVENFRTLSCTLYGTLSELAVNEDAKYIIMVPHHVVAIEVIAGFVYFIDNHTKIPIDARGSARLSQRVERVYKVTARELPVFIKHEVIVETSYERLQFFCINYYKNPEDNTKISLGYLIKSKLDPLMQISELLEAHIADRRSDSHD